MNDHHLDPPDHPEPPEWVMSLESVIEDQDPPEEVATVLRGIVDNFCSAFNDDGPDEMLGERYDPEPNSCADCGKKTHGSIYCDECSEKLTCVHDKPFGHCDACDHAADLAYDAARESRNR